MRKFTIVLFFGLGLFYTTWGQSQKLTGDVKDGSTNAPLPGVSVFDSETQVGTTTDENGHFELNAEGNQAKNLTFRFLGFETKVIEVIPGKPAQVTLDLQTNSLEEVVAIGYGTTKRKDLTGAVGTVSGGELAKVPVASVEEALTGKLAGVQVTSTEGSPDAEMRIRVRGGGSITGDNTPLFIVDGFPVETISDIAPSDIESIDVLKDASSTAIYGSRGANGVIIVTTKSGKSGKLSVNVNAYGGPKKIARELDVLSPGDYIKWQYERALLNAPNGINTYQKYFGNYQDMDLYSELTPNNWQDLVFGRTGSTFNYNVSVSGGDEKTKYLASYNHQKDDAIMQMSNYKRDNISLKLNHKAARDKISLDFSVRYSDLVVNGGGMNEQNEVSSADSRLKYAMIYPPFPVSGLTNSTETDDDFNLYNPLTAISDNDRYQKRINYNMNAGLSWKIIQNLSFSTRVGLDYRRDDDNRFYGNTTYYVKNVPAEGLKELPAIIFNKRSRDSYRNTNTLTYDFKSLLPEDHHLDILAGQEFILSKDGLFTSVVHGFPKDFTFADATKLSPQGTANSVNNFLSPDDKLLSFFGRANYNFRDRYLLSATFRADGSSKFSEGNRWGYFPSVAVAWRLSSEEFMQDARSWLSDLKLRASYGTAGNNNIPAGQITQTFNVSTTSWVNDFNSFWAASKTMANPNLKWETTITRNVGLDFGIADNRLSGTLDLYQNNTRDLLIKFPVPGTGYDNQYRNMGETQNKGLELSLNWAAIEKRNFGLNLSFNIGFNKNKIISLGQMEDFGQASGWASTEIGNDFLIQTGHSVGVMYGYRNAGRYEVGDFSGYDANADKWILNEGVADATPVTGVVRPGSMKLVDISGDGLIDASDQTIIGNANPKHTGGFNLNARIFNFDVSAFFNWSYGNDIYNANKIEYTSTSKYHSRNMIDVMADGKRWTNLLPDGTLSNDPHQLAEMNENTTMWSPYMTRFVFSDWAVEDGSFLRLNTLTLGYTVPGRILNRIGIEKFRVYATAYNVFVLTNYTGFDPEVSTRRQTPLTPGVDYSAYPKSRLLVFGINLSF